MLYAVVSIIVLVCSMIFVTILIITDMKNEETRINNKSDVEKIIISKMNFEEMEQIEKVRKLVEEWEEFGLCAPGDWASSAAHRCKTFRNCHECLLEYAYTHQDVALISEKLGVTEIVDSDTQKPIDFPNLILNKLEE